MALNVPNGVSLNAFNNSLSYNLLSLDNSNYLTPIIKDIGIDSLYLDDSSLRNFLNSINQDKELSVFSINIAGLASKFIHLRNFVDTLYTSKLKIDIICIQECYLFDPKYFQINGYDLFLTLRTSGNRGGVAIYINDNFNCKQLTHSTFFTNNIPYVKVSSKLNTHIISTLQLFEEKIQ